MVGNKEKKNNKKAKIISHIPHLKIIDLRKKSTTGEKSLKRVICLRKFLRNFYYKCLFSDKIKKKAIMKTI